MLKMLLNPFDLRFVSKQGFPAIVTLLFGIVMGTLTAASCYYQVCRELFVYTFHKMKAKETQKRH